jgi:hypothetical protein
VNQEAFNGATNPRVDARNAVAKALAETEGIPIMEHLYVDSVYFQ